MESGRTCKPPQNRSDAASVAQKGPTSFASFLRKLRAHQYYVRLLTLQTQPIMLSYIVWDIAPDVITFTLFGTSFPIHWYSLLFASGFLAGQQLLTYLFRSDKISVHHTDTLLLYVALATVVGARLGHYLF